MLLRSYTDLMPANPVAHTQALDLPSALLGGHSPRSFCRTVWHRKPLLIHQAVANVRPPLSRDELFALAARDEVQSRLVSANGVEWALRHGPFRKLPSLRKRQWTLLVQGVNLHDQASHDLLQQFGFLSRARLDDLMISFATDGGGVGPHVDSYDVFLLQVQGQRRWRISQQTDLRLVDGLPLKILRKFQPEQEFVLNPGDMLYLPPNVAHEGTAIGECMTCSIGFRAASHQELLVDFHEWFADMIEVPGQLSNAQASPSPTPGHLPDVMIESVLKLVRQNAPTRDDVVEFLGCRLTQPTPALTFLPTRPRRGLALALAKQSIALYTDGWFFINGQAWQAEGADAGLLQQLADTGRLDALSIQSASHEVQAQLREWTRNGWIRNL
jgi:50S ribosomal protein L16 3-hydroxylase